MRSGKARLHCFGTDVQGDGWPAIFVLALSIISGFVARHVPAQTLARKGWAGSGIGVEPWWQSAVFYEVDGDTGIPELLARLDYLHSLGVDAIVLSPPHSKGEDSGRPASSPEYGSDEEFDQLEQGGEPPQDEAGRCA